MHTFPPSLFKIFPKSHPLYLRNVLHNPLLVILLPARSIRQFSDDIFRHTIQTRNNSLAEAHVCTWAKRGGTALRNSRQKLRFHYVKLVAGFEAPGAASRTRHASEIPFSPRTSPTRCDPNLQMRRRSPLVEKTRETQDAVAAIHATTREISRDTRARNDTRRPLLPGALIIKNNRSA